MTSNNWQRQELGEGGGVWKERIRILNFLSVGTGVFVLGGGVIFGGGDVKGGYWLCIKSKNLGHFFSYYLGREEAFSNLHRTNSFFKLADFLQTISETIINELKSAAPQGRQITFFFSSRASLNFIRHNAMSVAGLWRHFRRSGCWLVDLNLMHCRCDIVVSRPEEEWDCDKEEGNHDNCFF